MQEDSKENIFDKIIEKKSGGFKHIYPFFIIIFIILAITAILWIANEYYFQQDEIGNCIQNMNISLYYMDTCPYCQQQLTLLEEIKEYKKYINIVNCNEKSYQCIAEQIEKVPTWQIEGDRIVGIINFTQIIDYCNFKITQT